MMIKERRTEVAAENHLRLSSAENLTIRGSTRQPQSASGGRALSIWLADDKPGILSLIAELIENCEGFRIARQFPSAEALLAALAVESAPDAVLMDVNMGGMTGIEAIAPVKRLAGGTRVFIMTTFFDGQVASDARKGGAAGFFLKSGDWPEALERILDPARDWTSSSAGEVPLQWEMRESDFGPAAGANWTEQLDAPNTRNATPVVPANDRPLLARGLALARAFFTRQSCEESAVQQ